MKRYDFRVVVGAVNKTVSICAENYTIASNLIKCKFPASAIIWPVRGKICNVQRTLKNCLRVNLLN